LKNPSPKLADEFTTSQAKWNTEDIIYCKIVLTHLGESNQNPHKNNTENRSPNHDKNCNRNY